MALSFPSSLQQIEEALSRPAAAQTQHTFDAACVNAFRHRPLYESALLQWVLTIWHRGVDERFWIPVTGSEKHALEQLSLNLPGRALALLPPGKITPIT